MNYPAPSNRVSRARQLPAIISKRDSRYVPEGQSKGIVLDSLDNIVYACKTEGPCETHDVKLEQLENLSSMLSDMGVLGWELVQLSFHKSGIVTFWKRALSESA